MIVVIDANVAAKWYIPEAGTETALDLIDGPNRIYAPALIRMEVLAAIAKRARRGEATPAESLQRCEAWFAHLGNDAVSLVPDENLLAQAFDISLQIRHPLQDCLYVATALQLDAPLITADRTLKDRAKGVCRRISLLAGCDHN